MCVSPDWLLLVPLLFPVVVGLWLQLVLLFSGSSREGGRCLKASSLAMTCSWPHRTGLSRFEDSWQQRKRLVNKRGFSYHSHQKRTQSTRNVKHQHHFLTTSSHTTIDTYHTPLPLPSHFLSSAGRKHVQYC